MSRETHRTPTLNIFILVSRAVYIFILESVYQGITTARGARNIKIERPPPTSGLQRTGRRAELFGVKLGFPRSRCRAVISDMLCVRSYVHFVCVCVYMCMCVCVRLCIYIYVHVCMYMYMYAFIHMCMCMYMHICA